MRLFPTSPRLRTASLSQVRDAYSRNTTSQHEASSISGNYQASEGAISFDIHLSNFTFILNFDLDGFLNMELTKIEGNTLTFESEDEKIVKLNREKSGLKLIDSNLLPEYKGLYFRRIKKI